MKHTIKERGLTMKRLNKVLGVAAGAVLATGAGVFVATKVKERQVKKAFAQKDPEELINTLKEAEMLLDFAGDDMDEETKAKFEKAKAKLTTKVGQDKIIHVVEEKLEK